MKIFLYTMSDCPYCLNIKKELKNLPDEFQKPIEIDYNNITNNIRNKYDIRIFPTIVFLNDNNSLMKKIVGFHKISDIINVYKEVNILNEILIRGI